MVYIYDVQTSRHAAFTAADRSCDTDTDTDTSLIVVLALCCWLFWKYYGLAHTRVIDACICSQMMSMPLFCTAGVFRLTAVLCTAVVAGVLKPHEQGDTSVGKNKRKV